MLHIVVSGGAAELGDFVVRAALDGNSKIVTVVGQSGVEIDEADVLLPKQVVFWNTVVP
jgi:hypothetical protein